MDLQLIEKIFDVELSSSQRNYSQKNCWSDTLRCLNHKILLLKWNQYFYWEYPTWQNTVPKPKSKQKNLIVFWYLQISAFLLELDLIWDNLIGHGITDLE